MLVGSFSKAPGNKNSKPVEGIKVWQMKRKGYLIEKIADMDNLRAADREAQAGKVKENRFIRRYNEHAEEDLMKLRQMILSLDFPSANFTSTQLVSDAGKMRNIVKQKYYPWRILHHAIMRVIEPDFERNFIHDTSACIKGRGLHYGVKRMQMFLRRYPQYKWFVKTDYKKFYESISHDVILSSLWRKYKDEHFIRLIEIAILSYDSGIDTINSLNNEKKKRNSNRLLYKSATG